MPFCRSNSDFSSGSINDCGSLRKMLKSLALADVLSSALVFRVDRLERFVSMETDEVTGGSTVTAIERS